MKGFGFLCLLLLIGAAAAAAAAFLYLGHSTGRGLNPGVAIGSIGINVDQTSIVKKRNLKVELIDPGSLDEDGVSGGLVHLEDYQPIDPVPRSKASIRPGPIQHGTPVMPYVPKPIASPPPRTLPKLDG